MSSLKTSLICTVLNEEETIENFIYSVLKQSILPTELIIVDGGSKDKTLEKINILSQKFRKILNIKILFKKGNRSVGRNEGIKQSNHEIILLTDSGCILDKNWVKEIIKPFNNPKTEVVAGYYKGLASNVLQESLILYVLVMPDKVNEENFLPATRSMAFKKLIWKKLKGFNENLSHNEDYDFAQRLVKHKINIEFAKKAVVNWKPRKNIKESFIMFFRFAFGDAEAGILRIKVMLLFLRYFLFFYFCFLTIVYKSILLFSFICVSAVIYIFWSILKNSRYVQSNKKIFYLPMIQITADIAVLLGTILGVIKRCWNFKYLNYIKNNKIFVSLLFIYGLITLSQISWGIPNSNHPFLYHMDEWHQLQSVRFVFKYGTPNLPGAANGTMFHFFYSGLYLIPFILFNIVNPFAIKSAIDNIPAQHTLFIILRLESLILGILSIIFIYKISKLLKLNSFITLFFFIFNPLWLMLSNYFKYDIGLMFWLTLSLYSFIKYYKKPTTYNFILSGIISALALSVKVSALPILIVYGLSFVLFTPNIVANIKRGFLGLSIFLLTVCVFGIPDLIFGGYSIYSYIYDNLVSIPNITNSMNVGYSYLSYIYLHHFPTIFGHGFYTYFVISFIFFIVFMKNKLKLNVFILLSFTVFLVSLIPLKFFLVGNRALVLLPFMVLITSSVFSNFKVINHKLRRLIILGFLILIVIQILESYAWVSLKYTVAPQQASSKWVLQNIPVSSMIGVESIPLYQAVPDIVLKEFYAKQYKIDYKSNYKYSLIDYKSKYLPNYIIIGNSILSLEIDKNSSKKKLIQRLKMEKYKLIFQSQPQLNFYKLFGNNFNFIYSGLIAYPTDISIFKKYN